MEQLSGLDAAFLYLETAATPMHIGSLCIYDQSTAPGGKVGFKDIIRFFDSRLHKARAFRRRLAKVPLSLGHPYWIEDPHFDLEFHLRHIALPKPGDWRQLCIQTARLLARPLDLSRPLWEAWVIEGLDNVDGIPKNSFALVTKVHHAAIDGISGAEIAMAVHDIVPDADVSPPVMDWAPGHEPTAIEMLARSTWRGLGFPSRLGRLAYDGSASLARLGTGLLKGDIRMPGGAPRTRFNDNVSPHRVFDAVSFGLDDVRRIKSAVEGATVNDVMVSVCGGALRRYLAAKDELPEDSLVAMAPVSVRNDDKRRSEGNLLTVMSLPIRSDVDDPLERLRAVHDESVEAKRFTFAAGLGIGLELADFIPSTTTGLLASAWGRLRVAERIPPTFNTVITNVPVGNVPLYSMGSQMMAYYGLGPLYHGIGLFQSLIGYGGRISVNVVSCREMMPDPAFYCDCLRESFAELEAAAATVTA